MGSRSSSQDGDEGRGTLEILTFSPARGKAGLWGAGLTGRGVILIGSGALLGDSEAVALGGTNIEVDTTKAAALADWGATEVAVLVSWEAAEATALAD